MIFVVSFGMPQKGITTSSYEESARCGFRLTGADTTCRNLCIRKAFLWYENADGDGSDPL